MKFINVYNEKSHQQKFGTLFGISSQRAFNPHTLSGTQYSTRDINSKLSKKKSFVQFIKPSLQPLRRNVLPPSFEYQLSGNYLFPPPKARLESSRPMLRHDIIPSIDNYKGSKPTLEPLTQINKGDLNTERILSIFRHKHGKSNVKIKQLQDRPLDLNTLKAPFNFESINLKKPQTAYEKRPDSRFNKKGRFGGLENGITDRPEYKIPINKMNFEENSNNELLPECWK